MLLYLGIIPFLRHPSFWMYISAKEIVFPLKTGLNTIDRDLNNSVKLDGKILRLRHSGYPKTNWLNKTPIHHRLFHLQCKDKVAVNWFF
jgi:hypothetical protein